MTAMTALTAPAATPVRDLGIARLRIQPGRPAALAVGGSPARVPSLPLVECLTVETGRAFVDHRLTRTAQGAALRPVTLEEKEGPWPHHLLTQRDETTGLVALTDLWRPTPASLRVRTRVRNDGAAPLHLTALSILSATVLPGAPLDDLDLMTAPSAWMAEQRWRHQRLGKELVDVGTAVHGQSSRDALRLSAESGWSSSRWEPVGILTDPAGGQALAWQVEHNGAWTVEVSRRGDVLGLVVCGPTDLQHGWMRVLHPGQEAATPTAALVLSDGGWQGAAVELTAYRRALRERTAPTTDPAPVVFNDYMNTLMADPTAERLATLVPAAARAGAEVYCIDDGWHSDEEDGAWWDAVGAWEPSARRFPEGLGATLDLIRAEGMSPGLWIEPLAVGARSPLARSLPAEAFMRRGGSLLIEQGRLRLDMRHPAAREHLDAVVDRMVGYGIGYLKVDDNYSAGAGPDAGADSAGDALLEHSRAWAGWLAALGRRHPGLVVENCASGGMTTDYALLAAARLQSTSDLQDPLRYPPIAANAPLTVLPEQAASWGYPQPGMSDEEIVYTLVTSLAGSVYLSGHLDRMSDHQIALVRAAADLAKALRTHLCRDAPWWPADVAGWNDPWVVAARAASPHSREGILLVWHRPGLGSGAPEILLPALADCDVEQIYPPRDLVPEPGLRAEPGPHGLRLTGAATPLARAYLVRSHHCVNDAA